MKQPTPSEIQDVVVRVKQSLHNTDILPEHLDSVASTMAFFELLNASNSNGQRKNDPSVGIMFPATFAEWTQRFSVKNHYERFLAATVYLMEQEGIKAVNTGHVGKMYEKARWKKPANMADVFAKAAEKVYFVEAPQEMVEEDGLKMWQITRTGYEYFQSLSLED